MFRGHQFFRAVQRVVYDILQILKMLFYVTLEPIIHIFCVLLSCNSTTAIVYPQFSWDLAILRLDWLLVFKISTCDRDHLASSLHIWISSLNIVIYSCPQFVGHVKILLSMDEWYCTHTYTDFTLSIHPCWAFDLMLLWCCNEYWSVDTTFIWWLYFFWVNSHKCLDESNDRLFFTF